jgi:hypothetical protein
MTRPFYLHTYRTDQFIKLTACLQLGFPTSVVRITVSSSQHQTQNYGIYKCIDGGHIQKDWSYNSSFMF